MTSSCAVEHAPLGRSLGEDRLEIGQRNVSRRRHGRSHPDLHDGARVRAVARLCRGSAAGVCLVRVTREVVVARVERRERCRSIVVENESLAGVLGEVNDDIRPFRRAQ